jgi:ATP-dependent Lon protease
VKDLVEIPDNIKNRLDIQPVKWIEQVLEAALERSPEPLSEDAAAETPAPVPPASETPAVIKH